MRYMLVLLHLYALRSRHEKRVFAMSEASGTDL